MDNLYDLMKYLYESIKEKMDKVIGELKENDILMVNSIYKNGE